MRRAALQRGEKAMAPLAGRYTVWRDGRSVGSVTFSREGIYTRMRCDCAQDTDDVLRLYCLSGGRTASLGIPAPEKGRLILTRRFTDRDLAALTADVPERFWLADAASVSEPAKPENPTRWRPAVQPAELFREPYLQAACRGLQGCLLFGAASDQTLLAVPFSPSAPFPLSALLSMGTWACLSGRQYILFRIADGLPGPLDPKTQKEFT